MRALRIFFCLGCLLFTSLAYTQTNMPRPAIDYGATPLFFEVNHGQAPAGIDFISRGSGPTLELRGDRATFAFSQSGQGFVQVTLQWLNATPHARVAALDPLSGRTNYLIGDQKNWIRNVPNYRQVQYKSIYSGIDLVYYGNHRQLEYDLQVSPHADVSKTRFAIQGADQLIAQPDGSLLLKTSAGDLIWKGPVAYQTRHGKRVPVNVAYKLVPRGATNGSGSQAVEFALGPYDHRRQLIIDPKLAYAALIGPSNVPQFVATDGDGSAYLLTSTISPVYPTTSGAYMPTGQFSWKPPSLYTQPNHPLYAISKFSPDGSTLIYSTYLGGSQFVCSDGNAYPPSGNRPAGIAVDANGNAIVVGQTDDTNFPVTGNAIQKTDKTCSVAIDITVSKLSADGSNLLYSTYLGSSGNDTASSVAVDSAENIYVGGTAQNSDFESTTNLSACTGYCQDAFITKINANGTLGYSLLFGGAGSGPFTAPALSAVAVDNSGHAYVGGYTSAPLPIVNALQPSFNQNDGFVGEVNATGTGFVFLTYLGGSLFSDVSAVAVDPAGNVYATGRTIDTDFPLANPYQSTNKAFSNSSGFLTKYSPQGQSYVYSTYLGGSLNGELTAISVGPDGTAYVIGDTSAGDYPVTPDAFQPANAPYNFTSVLTAMKPDGQALAYSTYISGNIASDSGTLAGSVAVTPDGQSAFVAGWYVNDKSATIYFPVTPGAYNHPHAGNPSNNLAHYQVSSAFVMKFCMSCAAPANLSIVSPQNNTVLTSPVNFNLQAYDPDGVAALQIYAVPGKVAYQTTLSSINTNLTLAPGHYGVVVQEWSDSGAVLKKTVNITVQNNAPAVTISSPAPNATVSNPVHVAATAKVNGTGIIVHYRVYSGNGVAVYDVNASTLNANVSLPQGAVNLTVVAWDSTGAVGSASEKITVNGGSGGDQVVVTSPVNFSTVSSPVTFSATATTSCTTGIYALQIYTDSGVLAYTAYASSVNQAISVAPGYHYGAVQAWDNCGATFSTPVQFRAQ